MPLSKLEKKEKVEEYVKLVGLQGFEDNYPNQLSGGMQQRLALARTLAVNPEILLLDEPFGALDSQTRYLMQELLLKIWEDNRKTVLFVTHDIEEAIYLGDKIYTCSRLPASIISTKTNNFKRPRYFDLRADEKFNKLKIEIHRILCSQ